MDAKTLQAYKQKAQDCSEDWMAQPAPVDMYQLLQKYFIPKGKTADIGCGNGRDSGWMQRNGFEVTGFDSSLELVEISKKLFPKVSFQQAFLPDLKEITEEFDNILCETVIMHLPIDQILSSIQSLKRILKSKGVLYLSWRFTEGEDTRHADGRLYSAFPPELILKQFSKENILHFEEKISLSSSKRVCRLIFKK